MTRKQPTFYRSGDTYVALTGESPKDFKDYLFVAFTGNDPNSVSETCISRDDIQKMTKVDDVPADWADAFEAVGLKAPRNTTEASELWVGHMAAGLDPFTAAAASGYEFGDNDEPLRLNFTFAEVVGYTLAFWAFTIWFFGKFIK